MHSPPAISSHPTRRRRCTGKIISVDVTRGAWYPPATTFRLAEGLRRVRAGIAGRLQPRALTVIYRDTQPKLIRWPENLHVYQARTRALYGPCQTTRQNRKLARFTR